MNNRRAHNLPDYLMHYGVRGMKWGVRKDRSRKAQRRVKSLSDEELRAKVNRLNMERQYLNLTASSRPKTRAKMERGSDYVRDLMLSNADYAVKRATKNITKMAVDRYTKNPEKLFEGVSKVRRGPLGNIRITDL